MSAVLKAFAVSPDKRVKKLEVAVEAADRKIGTITAHAVELQAALDAGDGDAAAIVATAAMLATARAERAVLVRPLEAARQIVAQAAAEEAARQEEARINALVTEAEGVGDELQAALAEACRHLGRFIPLEAGLRHAGVLKFGIEHYAREAGKVACKGLVIPWGHDPEYERSVQLLLTVPLK